MSDQPAEPVPAVWLREQCVDCGGSGETSVPRGAGDARWSKRVACETCQGVGRTARWVALPELRELLDAVPASRQG